MAIQTFQRKILTYYKRKGRDLPWRHTKDPYNILISEIMLQQTQVDRVIDYYVRWLNRWPTMQSLSRARTSTVLKMWSGLGYNKRAVNLHKAAQLIVKEYKGDVIAALHDYKQIPGIGPYTAAAVRIFATNENIVTVDTNIRRILLHEFKLPPSTSDEKLQALAEKVLPKNKSRDWHNALMDYGATFLTAKRSGIKPKTKQSTFEGSDRQLRGAIVRYLLKNKSATSAQLAVILESTTKRLQPILEKMLNDEIIRLRNKQFMIV